MNGGGPPGWQVPGQPWLTVTPQGIVGTAPPPIPGQQWTQPGLAYGEREQGFWSTADQLQAQRQAAAQQYLARVQGGQRAALAQQQLGLGGMQQQQMFAGARGPLAQRAAMYGQSRAAGDMIAQQALAAAQEEQAAQALLQQTYGAGAQQKAQQAQQQVRGWGMAQQIEADRAKAAAAKQQAEADMIAKVTGGAISAAAAGATISDRRLKTNVRRPRTAAEEELLRALMEAGDV
jgi:hypothetical protein